MSLNGVFVCLHIARAAVNAAAAQTTPTRNKGPVPWCLSVLIYFAERSSQETSTKSARPAYQSRQPTSLPRPRGPRVGLLGLKGFSGVEFQSVGGGDWLHCTFDSGLKGGVFRSCESRVTLASWRLMLPTS